MAKILTAELRSPSFHEMAADVSAADLEQFKLDRLKELRAVIDSLRVEPACDPLLELCAERDDARA